MRIEIAQVQAQKYGGVEIGEKIHVGDVSAVGGEIKFSDGKIEVEKTDTGVKVKLAGLRGIGLFHWKNLRRDREIGLGEDGGGGAQIDKKYMLIVHEHGSSGIYERLGRREVGGYHHESYWHL